MISANLLAIFYLISGILFILALRGLSSPETSRQGNLFGILGMIIAITVTFLTVGNFFHINNLCVYISTCWWSDWSIRCVTKNPPKIFTAAKTIAKNPNILDISKIFSDEPAKAAMIAPTIITDEIALVTDISGV